MNEKIRTKAQFFFNNRNKVHIKDKSDRFFNGVIKEIAEEYLIFHDRVVGDTIIYFSDIRRIDVYQEVIE